MARPNARFILAPSTPGRNAPQMPRAIKTWRPPRLQAEGLPHPNPDRQPWGRAPSYSTARLIHGQEPRPRSRIAQTARSCGRRCARPRVENSTPGAAARSNGSAGNHSNARAWDSPGKCRCSVARSPFLRWDIWRSFSKPYKFSRPTRDHGPAEGRDARQFARCCAHGPGAKDQAVDKPAGVWQKGADCEAARS